MTVNPIAMALMPISHTISWYLILQATSSRQEDSSKKDDDDVVIIFFYQRISQISAFYALWALYKIKVEGNKRELGHFSFGLLSASSWLFGASANPTTRRRFKYLVAAFVLLVLLNFGLVLPYFINRGVKGIVKIVHREQANTTIGIIWGYTFLLYVIGNLLLWLYVGKTILTWG